MTARAITTAKRFMISTSLFRVAASTITFLFRIVNIYQWTGNGKMETGNAHRLDFLKRERRLQSSKLSLPKPFLSVFLTVSLTPNEKECQAKPGAGPVPECLAGNPHQGRPNESAKTPSVSIPDLQFIKHRFKLGSSDMMCERSYGPKLPDAVDSQYGS